MAPSKIDSHLTISESINLARKFHLDAIISLPYTRLINMTEDIKNLFSDNGYIIIRKLFTSDEVAILRNAVNNIIAEARNISPPDYGLHKIMHHGSQFVLQDNIIHGVVWAGAAEPQLLEIPRQYKFLSIVAQLLQTDKLEHLIQFFSS
jgi:hypothetical protein